MSTKPDDALLNLADGLAEDVLKTPSDELLREVQEDHGDSRALAVQFDQILASARAEKEAAALLNLADALAEDVLNTPDDELLRAVEEDYGDPQALATQFQQAVASDDMLLRLIVAGDMRAMKMLYARHNVRVYRFILKLTKNRSLTEDLVSEVFLDVWRYVSGKVSAKDFGSKVRRTRARTPRMPKSNFESKSKVSAPLFNLLFTIARRKALSAMHRRGDEHLDDEHLDDQTAASIEADMSSEFAKIWERMLPAFTAGRKSK
jgi:DNA-directed RNA polymerase specialized sigma24 family protein